MNNNYELYELWQIDSDEIITPDVDKSEYELFE